MMQDRKRNSFLIVCAAALIWFAMYAYVPTLPAYAASIGADVATIGLIGGVYGIGQMALRIPLGLISDRIGKDRALLVTGFALLSFSSLLFLVTDTVDSIILGRTIAGFAAAWWVVITASYAKYQPEDKQVKGQGILSASSSLGKLVSAVACAFAAQALGYKSTFAISLAGAALGLVLMFFLKKPQAARIEPALFRTQIGLLKNKHLWAFSLLCALAQMQCFALPTTYTSVVAEGLGASSMDLGMLVAVYFAAVGLSSFFVGSKLYKRIGGIKVLISAFLIGAVACVPVFYRSMPSVYAMQVVSGISYGIAQSQTAGFVIRCVPPEQRGAATGIFQSLFAVGIFFGPIVAAGIIEAASMVAAYWFYAGLACVSAALCPLLIPKSYDKMT